MKPALKDRKKFDLDLKYGQIRETAVADMLQGCKIEVKSERDLWQKTGNIAFEYESSLMLSCPSSLFTMS